MPTVLFWRGHRFHFYAADGMEPPHVHIDKDSNSAKVWLNGLDLAYNRGYSAKQIAAIVAQVEQHRTEFLERWNEFFGF